MFHVNSSKSPVAVIWVSDPAHIDIVPSTVSSGGRMSSTSIYIVTDVDEEGDPSSVAVISIVFMPGALAINVPVMPAFGPSV